MIRIFVCEKEQQSVGNKINEKYDDPIDFE
jgi:hypothetical protein